MDIVDLGTVRNANVGDRHLMALARSIVVEEEMVNQHSDTMEARVHRHLVGTVEPKSRKSRTERFA